MKYPRSRSALPQAVPGTSRFLHRIYGCIAAVNTHAGLGFRIVRSIHLDPKEVEVARVLHVNANS